MPVEAVEVDPTGRVSVTGLLFTLMCVLWYCHRKKAATGPGGGNLPPGSFGLPVLGETISLARQKAEFFRERRIKFGNIFKTHLFFRPTVRVIGASNVRLILLGENKIVKTVNPKGVRELVGGESLSQSQGKQHGPRKRRFMQDLTGENLSNYVAEIVAMIQEALQDWSSQPSVPLCTAVERLALGLILSILYGRNISKDDLNTLGSHVKVLVENLFSLPLNLPGTPYNKAMAARHRITEFAQGFIRDALEKSEGTKVSPMLCTVLKQGNLEEGMAVTEEILTRLADSSVELTVVGRGTMFSTITNAVLLLSQHPEVVEKVCRELADHSVGDPQEVPLTSVGLKTLQSLTYLDHVVKEVLRLYPPVGGGYRQAMQSFELDGYVIPKDWAVAFSIRETHESQCIPRRDEFDPDRWEYGNPDRPDRQRFAYIPFGAGARSCPGKQFAFMAIKLVLLELARGYDWSVLDSYNMVLFPTPRPDVDVRVRFTGLKR